MNIAIDGRMIGRRHGGIGRYELELCRHVFAIDTADRYTLFYNPKTCDPQDLSGFHSLPHVTLTPVNVRHYSLGEQISFYRTLKKGMFDVVHFPNFNVPLGYRGPFVVTIHDLVHHNLRSGKKSRFLHHLAYRKIIQNAADRAAAILTVSESSKRDIIALLRQPAEKILVTFEGSSISAEIDTAAVERVKRKFFLRRAYFVFVGVLERKKNLVALTRGFDSFISERGLDMDLVVVGRADPHYPEIRHQAADIKHSDRLVFTGQVSDEDLSALYKGAYAYVSASVHEGFGLPGVEAMRFGLPLAVANSPVFNEIYDDAAVYFDPLDPADISAKLHLLATDPEFYRKMSLQSLNRSRLFDWKQTARLTVACYQQAGRKGKV